MLVALFFFYGANAQTAKQTLTQFLNENAARLNVDAKDFAELHVTNEMKDNTTGIHHIYAQQRFNGIDVVGGVFSLHGKNGKQYEANNLIKSNEYSIASTASVLTAEQAVRKILAEANHPQNVSLRIKQQLENKIVFERGDNPAFNIHTRKVYYPEKKFKKLQLAWEIQLFDATERHFWVIYVDAVTGRTLEKKDAIIHCRHDHPFYHTDENGVAVQKHFPENHSAVKSKVDNPSPFSTTATASTYRVFPVPYEAPNDAGATHSLTTTAGDGVSSPDGWHKVFGLVPYNYTRGNNVWAFYDGSPTPLGGVPNPATVAYPTSLSPIEPYTFDYPFNPASEPETYRNAAIVNLFYWNNLLHDVFYHFGFNENLNFQDSHIFSTGPRGPADLNGQGDAVLAQAQDGGGTNNANFLTLPDGIPAGAQMQMYVFTTATADQLVQITSSTSGTPPAGTKYTALQGSFSTLPIANTDLYNNPVLNRQFVIVQRNALSTVGDDDQGCTSGQQGIALPPANDVNGKIVIIDRGNCSFVEKVFGAQLGGAAGVIVVNNVDGAPIAMGGSDGTTNAIVIPAVMVSKADGEAIKNAILGGATIIGSLKKDTPNPPKRDGDFDNAVIGHEYGHGISNRFTGGGDVLLPLGGDEQGGEGWSDFIGLYMITRTNDLGPATAEHPNGTLPTKGMGTYVSYQPATTGDGIRPSRYNINKSQVPYSFKDIGRGGEISIPHGVGHIWCQMLYTLEQTFIDQYGFNDNIYEAANPVGNNPPPAAKGNNIAMRLVLEGMKLQPVNPTFEQQRDAILKADTLLYSAQHACKIWKAFATWGLGFSAKSNTDGVGDEVEAFDIPPACDPTQVNITLTVQAPDRVFNGTNITYTVKAKNVYPGAINSLLVTDTLPSVTNYISNTGGGIHASGIVTWPITSLNGNEEKTFSVTAQVVSPTAGTEIVYDSHEDGEAGWVKQGIAFDGTPTSYGWNIVNNNPYSGNNVWFAPDVNGNSNMTLTTSTSYAIPAGGAELIFFHKYATESGFDGGVVEISSDGGTTWNYLPPNKFVRNGYNGIIPIVNNPLIGTSDAAAFTGTIGDYVCSIASLGDYAGQNIRIRFRMTSDVGTVVDGWYIDDVYIMVNRIEIRNGASGKAGNNASFTGNVDNESASKTSFVIGGANTPLPATITQLKATPASSTIKLGWASLQETNFQEFEIERQAQNETSFSTIGTLRARGTSNSRTEYEFNDANVQKNLLYSYRLKMVNNDGTYRYSNIATSKLGSNKTFGFTIAPNPATTSINFTFNEQPAAGAQLIVYDVAGKRLATFNAANMNAANATIDIASFSNGVYWLELNDNGRKQTQKLVIQR